MKLDPVDTWLRNVAYSHSRSEGTPKNYRWGLNYFCEFAECTPQQILDEYEVSTERGFRRKWAGILKAFISQLSTTDLTISTIANIVTAVKSFFKYMDLPLGYVPLAKKRVTYHNRDITKQEIVAVINISSVRDKAFFTMAAQTGLAPGIMCKLRVKDINPEFDKGIIPFCVRVSEENAKGQFGAYFSFAGEETRKSLQAYFKTRDRLGPEDYLFTNIGTDDMLNSKSISNLFSKALRQLRADGTLSYEVRPGKHGELRLYCLRKYFRNKSQAGVDFTNFWMGHSTSHKAPEIPRSDDHYFSREAIERHRILYRDLAMPHLRLESRTPSELEQIIKDQAEKIDELERRTKILDHPLLEKVLTRVLKELEREE